MPKRWRLLLEVINVLTYDLTVFKLNMMLLRLILASHTFMIVAIMKV